MIYLISSDDSETYDMKIVVEGETSPEPLVKAWNQRILQEYKRWWKYCEPLRDSCPQSPSKPDHMTYQKFDASQAMSQWRVDYKEYNQLYDKHLQAYQAQDIIPSLSKYLTSQGYEILPHQEIISENRNSPYEFRSFYPNRVEI